MMTLILWAIAIVVLMAIVIAFFAWFYQRSTNEVALIRTGVGGRKVVLDGGTIAIPYFHEISRVNMQTLRLDVHRASEAALITKDRLRVDVGVEFYLSVTPSVEGVVRASQTLGRRTFQPDALRDLIDGMLVDALRSVAARLSMDELHENRGSFVAEVGTGLTEVLARFGLQLDSVSLTALDQTSFSALDENNAFNAVGMRKLAEVISRSRKERAEIDSDAEVSVRRVAMEAAKLRLEIELEERKAEIAQQQAVEILLAQQLGEVARRKAHGELEAAQARIQMEQAIEAADIVREREGALAEQERRIVVATKSQEESKALAAADFVRADAAKAAESITTAQRVAEAERMREVALVEARKDVDLATTLGQARRDNADVLKYEKLAEAEGIRARIEADNLRTADIVALDRDLAKLEALPKIVAEMVKPAEKIKSINVHNLSGFGGSGGSGGNQSAVNMAIDSIMGMAVQLPALKRIGEEVGLSLEMNADEGDEEANEAR